MGLLNDLTQDKGITIVLATHDMDIVPSFADDVYVMSNGQVKGRGTPLEIFSNERLIRENNLRLPIVYELAKTLRTDGVPIEEVLTISELREQINLLYRGKL